VKRQAAGFTLVEVLVAVAILAIAMSAVITAMARQADNSGYLRQKTIALWVAHNKLTEIMLDDKWPGTSKSDETVEMAGAEWKCEVEVKDTEDDRLRRVDVTVSQPKAKKGSSLAQLSGFIGKAGREGGP
jgi:general secretion pathway protein I